MSNSYPHHHHHHHNHHHHHHWPFALFLAGANGQMIFLCTSLVPRAPEENPQMDAVAKLIAEAEHLEFQAKEAQELADKHAQLLELESEIILQLAVEIFNRCT